MRTISFCFALTPARSSFALRTALPMSVPPQPGAAWAAEVLMAARFFPSGARIAGSSAKVTNAAASAPSCKVPSASDASFFNASGSPARRIEPETSITTTRAVAIDCGPASFFDLKKGRANISASSSATATRISRSRSSRNLLRRTTSFAPLAKKRTVENVTCWMRSRVSRWMSTGAAAPASAIRNHG